jgi:hypothetical protein
MPDIALQASFRLAAPKPGVRSITCFTRAGVISLVHSNCLDVF